MTTPPSPISPFSDTLLSFDRRLEELKHVYNFWYFLSSRLQQFRSSQIPDTPAHRLADMEYRNAWSKLLEAERERLAIEDQIRMYHELNNILQEINKKP